MGHPDQDASFPTTPIGRQLQVVAKLLTSRTPVAVLKVSHGSFDTHSNRRHRPRPPPAQTGCSPGGVPAGHANGQLERRYQYTYAEFDSRQRKTAAPAPTMARLHRTSSWAARYAADCTASSPALTDLVEGDLRHVVDYRSLYMTVARRWWGITGDFLQGRNFPVLDCLA